MSIAHGSVPYQLKGLHQLKNWFGKDDFELI